MGLGLVNRKYVGALVQLVVYSRGKEGACSVRVFVDKPRVAIFADPEVHIATWTDIAKTGLGL